MEASEVLKSTKSYLVLEGLLAILFGVSILLWPGVTLATVIIYVGVYGVVRGVIMLFKGIFADKSHTDKALSIVMGLVSLLFGMLVLNVPVAFAAYTTLLIAMLIGVQGIYYIVSSFEQTKEPMGSRVMLFIGGVISVLFTFWVFANPKAGAIAMLFYLAIMLILSGATVLAVGSSIKTK